MAVPPPPIISKPDAEFLALGLEFVETRDGIKITELNELFEKVRQAAVRDKAGMLAHCCASCCEGA